MKNEMRNWDDIRAFLFVARAGSLSGASSHARMDPATLGRRISRLEDELGAALFLKSPQGYVLTELGERIARQAGEAENALSRAMNVSPTASDELTGQIRLGAPDGCANFVLPQVCKAIRQDHPALEIQILSLPRVVNLSQREADMAITVSPPQTGRLTVQKVSDYALHLAQHRDLPVPRSTDDIEGLVGYIPDMIFDKELDYLGGLARNGVQMASNSVAVQVQVLRSGAGIGIVHDFALPSAPELRRVLTDQISLTRAFYLVRHASDRRSSRLDRFAQLLTVGIRAEVVRLETALRLTEEASTGDAEGTRA